MNQFITFKFKLEESSKEITKSFNIASVVCISKVPAQRIVDNTQRNVEAVCFMTSNGNFMLHADDHTLAMVLRLFEENKFDALCKSPVTCIYFG